MQVDKEEVVDLLRSRGDYDKAASVQCALPRKVDTEADAGLLHQFDVNVGDIARAAGNRSESDGPAHGHRPRLEARRHEAPRGRPETGSGWPRRSS